jgi:tRNA uridine 5-carboxymethylaminomethyl modification enzyme
MKYDVIVIGGGHAGIEAACAAAKMGCSVGLISMDKKAMGRMSCNPAIGGTAKGHLVREIDALGGKMGLIADRTGIQFRMLNKSKGPAVWSPRCQSDRDLYSGEALRIVEETEGITIIEDSAIDVIIEGNEIRGVNTVNGGTVECKALVLSSGTFLNALMHTGMNSISGGRFGENAATGITESLINAGLESGRLKTGTPPRLKKNSINWDILEEQGGDEDPAPFSHFTKKEEFPYLPQISCYITYTSEEVHQILETGFGESPLFTGLIKGTGPRYCPSIEDKVVRFSEKKRHQLFLEPEGLTSDLIYINGFSTSLPREIQLKALHKIKGLEETEMVRPGYAVEYDYFPPHQVDLTLETKLIKGLYFSGQINGTSGYEEAAAQGLIAGINAAAKIIGKPELVLKRSEAYIGVLIDDLVTKSTDEPYRMFTSRAEYRLLLRQDNADRRLMKYGYEFGLINKEDFMKLEEKKRKMDEGVIFLNQHRIETKKINNFLKEKDLPVIYNAETVSKLVKRSNITLEEILALSKDGIEQVNNIIAEKEIMEQLEIELKYEGYITRQQELIDKMEKYEDSPIPLNLDYTSIHSLSTEGREKLARVKPRSIGQASRISGVTPSDISILLVYLRN